MFHSFIEISPNDLFSYMQLNTHPTKPDSFIANFDFFFEFFQELYRLLFLGNVADNYEDDFYKPVGIYPKRWDENINKYCLYWHIMANTHLVSNDEMKLWYSCTRLSSFWSSGWLTNPIIFMVNSFQSLWMERIVRIWDGKHCQWNQNNVRNVRLIRKRLFPSIIGLSDN